MALTFFKKPTTKVTSIYYWRFTCALDEYFWIIIIQSFNFALAFISSLSLSMIGSPNLFFNYLSGSYRNGGIKSTDTFGQILFITGLIIFVVGNILILCKKRQNNVVLNSIHENLNNLVHNKSIFTWKNVLKFNLFLVICLFTFLTAYYFITHFKISYIFSILYNLIVSHINIIFPITVLSTKSTIRLFLWREIKDLMNTSICTNCYCNF